MIAIMMIVFNMTMVMMMVKYCITINCDDNVLPTNGADSGCSSPLSGSLRGSLIFTVFPVVWVELKMNVICMDTVYEWFQPNLCK